MRTLYITDLDGTLLNNSAQLTSYACDALNQMIDQGMQFTVATARTVDTVHEILAGLNLQIPAILMNGVLVYDLKNREYIKVENIGTQKALTIARSIRNAGFTAFMYKLVDNQVVTYYEHLYTDTMKRFYQQRVDLYNRTFIQVESLADHVDENVIYFTLFDGYDTIKGLHDEIDQLEGIKTTMYLDVYEKGLWYFEVFSQKASKYNAAQYLRQQYHIDQLVAFGDNLNDLPLFKASDLCFAVDNAKSEVKEAASQVIASNMDHGVVHCLQSHFTP